MSVLMTLHTKGDPDLLEKRAAANPQEMQAIVAAAKKAGVISHQFYGSDDGQILVVDEWPDAASFQQFFEAQRDKIGPMMAEVGATGHPDVTFWRKLDTHDEVG